MDERVLNMLEWHEERLEELLALKGSSSTPTSLGTSTIGIFGHWRPHTTPWAWRFASIRRMHDRKSKGPRRRA